MFLKSILFERDESLQQMLNDELFDVVDYASKNLKLLGKGTDRAVYDIGGNQILKVSVSGEQNYNEIKRWECINKLPNHEKYFMQIFDWDRKNYQWIIAEKLTPVTSRIQLEQIVQSLLQTKEEINYWEVIDGLLAEPKRIKRLAPEFWEVVGNSTWFQEFSEIVRECGIPTSDFREQNMGIRPSTGELVVLDLGYREDDGEV
jgi:hypothetical protein